MSFHVETKREIWHSIPLDPTQRKAGYLNPSRTVGGLWEQLKERIIIERSVNSCQHGIQGKSGYWIARGTINNDILMGLIDCLVPSSLCGFDMT